MLKKNEFSWIFFLNKRFGKKYKYTELGLSFILKQYQYFF